jgi:hypothetical protein
LDACLANPRLTTLIAWRVLAWMMLMTLFLAAGASVQSVKAPDEVRIGAMEQEALEALEKPISQDDYSRIVDLVDLRERLAKERDRARARMDASSAKLRLAGARLEALGSEPKPDEAEESAERQELRMALQA